MCYSVVRSDVWGGPVAVAEGLNNALLQSLC